MLARFSDRADTAHTTAPHYREPDIPAVKVAAALPLQQYEYPSSLEPPGDLSQGWTRGFSISPPRIKRPAGFTAGSP